MVNQGHLSLKPIRLEGFLADDCFAKFSLGEVGIEVKVIAEGLTSGIKVAEEIIFNVPVHVSGKFESLKTRILSQLMVVGDVECATVVL